MTAHGKVTRCLLLCALSALCFDALAMKDPDAMERAGQELVECGAYYLAATVSLEKAGKAEQAEQFQGFARHALDLSQTYFTVRSIARRLHDAQETNGEIIKTDGLSALVAKYGDSCKAALEKPGERLNYWRTQDSGN